MQANLNLCMPEVFKHEGGYVDHPKDPGGKTNLGITQKTLNASHAHIRDLPASVVNLTKAQATLIYERLYWKPSGGPALPSGVDYVALDGAINSGVSRGVRWVQAAVGAAQDGIMGPSSLSAVAAKPPVVVIERACSNRRGFLHGLSTFSTFGKGWTRRVNEVEAFALRLAVKSDVVRKDVVDRAAGRIDTEGKRTAQTTTGGAVATGGSATIDFSSVPHWVPWAIGAVALLLIVNQLGRVNAAKERAKTLKEALA